MKEAFVLIGFFVILLGLLYQVLKSVLGPANAFLAATATTVLLILGMFGMREGINHDTTFDWLRVYGAMRVRPQDSWSSASTFEFSPGNYSTYELKGHMYGSIN